MTDHYILLYFVFVLNIITCESACDCVWTLHASLGLLFDLAIHCQRNAWITW